VNTPLRRSGVARVLKGSHSFTCTPRVHPLITEYCNITFVVMFVEQGIHVFSTFRRSKQCGKNWQLIGGSWWRGPHTMVQLAQWLIRHCFRSRKKDGGHVIRSAVAENPTLHAHFTALCAIDAELLATEFYTARRSICHDTHASVVYLLWTFFGPVTLTLTP